MRAWWGGAALTLALTLGLAEGARRSGALIMPSFKSKKRVETPVPSDEKNSDTPIADRWFSWSGNWPHFEIQDEYKDELLNADER